MKLQSLREKCPYSRLFWSIVSHNLTEYGEILRISPYSDQMRENTDQNNREYGHTFYAVNAAQNIWNKVKKQSFGDVLQNRCS